VGIFDLFQKTPSPDKFGKIMSKAIADSGNSEPVRYDADEFCLNIGDSRVLNLHNAYRDYCAAPRGERAQVLEKYLHATRPAELPATFAASRAKLLPILRSRGLAEFMALSGEPGKIGASALASAPFSADTLVMLAYDTEHAIQTLADSTLTDWGVSFDEALAAAVENLRDITVSRFEQFVPGLFVSAWDDAYDVSRALFPDVLYQLGLGGDPVFMLPNRGRLLVASSNDKGGLMAMLALAEKVVEDEGRPVSALMYRYKDGKPVAYQAADPDVLARLSSLRRTFLSEDYASQKQLLEKIHENEAIDIFIATYQLVRRVDSGTVFSFGTWKEGVDTLLPETDLVALGNEAGDTKFVTWENLQPVVDALEKVPDRYPVRYRADRFPAKETIDSLPAVEM